MQVLKGVLLHNSINLSYLPLLGGNVTGAITAVEHECKSTFHIKPQFPSALYSLGNLSTQQAVQCSSYTYA